MMYKTDALLLKGTDLGESDRLATLLTADRGKISASFKGVRKAGARLSAAAQPFCFAEYVLAEKGGRYTVTQAAMHDGFYALRTDLTRFYAACAVTEVCDRLAYEGLPCGPLLVAAAEALGALEGDTGEHAKGVLVRFLLAALAFAGYPVRAAECAVCGEKIAGRRYFDFGRGAFTCASCAEGVPASESTYLSLRSALRGEAGSADGDLRALRLLKAYFAACTEAELPALGEFLKL